MIFAHCLLKIALEPAAEDRFIGEIAGVKAELAPAAVFSSIERQVRRSHNLFSGHTVVRRDCDTHRRANRTAPLIK